MAETLGSKIAEAVGNRLLMESTGQNIAAVLESAASPLDARVVQELVDAQEWNELNDRFYKTLAFGTGGLRGRTIGKVVTKSEIGTGTAERPEHPCVGTNAMNFYNIERATRGLVAYVKEWFSREQLTGKPKLVIAHDTRFFSGEFTALAAKVAAENGCDAFVFSGPRSTPELSFAVRHLEASAGIVITASHNPPHDNGYKVYFNDGAQVVEPHASGIIARVNAIADKAQGSHGIGGEVVTLGEEIDDAYMQRLATLVLDPALVQAQRALKIVFTPIHGTGGVIIKPMLTRLGFGFSTVAEQDEFDGRFPTVQSPNPENAEALRLGIEQAEREHADLVVATDPDCDRVGVAVRSREGGMLLLTGNQIGSLMAFYRAKTFFERGVLNKENAARGVLIKTFVTTDLQKAIAKHYGLRCVETLTGFKYIGAKLGKYERALGRDAALRRPGGVDDAGGVHVPNTTPRAPDGAARRPYHALSEDETRRLRIEHSSFYIFGGEESYGYSGADFVRDKDGNGAAIMFCEVAAYAKSRGLTLDALLDEVYATFGYYLEKNGAITFEGAEGAEKINRLLESYVSTPPVAMLGAKVAAVKNFEKEIFHDVEGDLIPKEKMLIFELEDRTRVAVRGSGTEPKIKYYLFAQRVRVAGKLTAAEVARAKREVGQHLEGLWSWLQNDADARLQL